MSSKNQAPGFKNHPDHKIEIHPFNGNLKVMVGEQNIAEINGALVLQESKYKPAYYISKSVLNNDMLEASSHTTYCPFKGDASYYHLHHNGSKFENAIWSYENPYEEVYAIKGYLSFYPNVGKVEPAEH